jgi:hypothetical protein
MLLLCWSAQAGAAHPCAADALKRAPRLLEFHFGEKPPHPVQIESSVKQLSSMRNPANRNQSFDVLELWANVYKGRYRMHFIYARLPSTPTECVLMGQEILEYASL